MRENIEISLTEIGWDGLDMTDLVSDMDNSRTVLNTVLNLQVPQHWGNLLTT